MFFRIEYRGFRFIKSSYGGFIAILMMSMLLLPSVSAQESSVPEATPIPPDETEFSGAGLSSFYISPSSQEIGTDGGKVWVTIRVASDSIASASAMTARVNLPAGWTISADVPTIVEGGGGPGQCTAYANVTYADVVFSAESVRRICDFRFEVTVPSGVAVGTYIIDAVANVTAGQNLDNPVEDISASVWVIDEFDLVASVETPLPATYAPNQELVGSVSFSNSGDDPATSVYATLSGLDLTTSLETSTVTCSQGGAACTDVTMVSGPDGSGNWVYSIASIEPGETPYLFTASSLAKANPSGQISLLGVVSAPTNNLLKERNGDNNVAESVSLLEEPTPTPSPTATETVVPSPTATETVVPSPTATETAVPTATATATDVLIVNGTVVVTLGTNTGNRIPDETIVCIADQCQELDALAAAAVASGTSVTFSDVPAGTWSLTVLTAGTQVYATSVDVVAGETLEVSVILSVGVGTPIPLTPGTTVTPDDTTIPVTSLPSTGSGGGTSWSAYLVLLGGAALVAFAGGLSWRQRQKS